MPYGKGSKRAGTKSGGGPHNPPFKWTAGRLRRSQAKAQAKAQGGTTVTGRPRGGSSRAAIGGMMGMGMPGGGNRPTPGLMGSMIGRKTPRSGLMGGVGFGAFFKRKRDGYAK